MATLKTFAGVARPAVTCNASFTLARTEGLVRTNGLLVKQLPCGAGTGQFGVPTY